MNFRSWSDVGYFPGVRELTRSHAFVEEFGQPFWHNATSYFQKFGMSLGELLDFILRFLMRSWILYASIGARNNEFFEFMFNKMSVSGRGWFIFVERDFPTSEKLLQIFTLFLAFWVFKKPIFVGICFLLLLFHWQASMFFLYHDGIFGKLVYNDFVWRFLLSG